MQLNFHTHQPKKSAEEVIIINQIIPQTEESLECLLVDDLMHTFIYSAGIHPWYISVNNQKLQLEKLRQFAKHQDVKLIGECGLDRIKGASLPLQEEIFIKQIRIAEEVKKPLIIHCVKCFNELISIKKIVHPKVPMIVHGFNNNLTIAQMLLDKGFYLSFGTAILQENSNAKEVLSQIPLEKLFFETDDKDIFISEIYEKASFILKTPLNKLEDIIFANYLEICA